MAFKAISHIAQALRVNNWWNYKIPPLFGFAFAMIYLNRDPFSEGVTVLALLLIWMIGAAGFGYYSNDLFDIEEDRKADKANRSASHPGWLRTLILAGLTLMALAPWSLLSWQPLTLSLAGMQLLLFLAYSAPPVRLKERGFAGILADGAYAHALPTAIVLSTFYTKDEIPQLQWLFVLLIAWQWIVGLRNIFLHQWKTADRDKTAGTNTWVLSEGKKATQKIASLALLPLEIAALAGILLLLILSPSLNFPIELPYVLLGIGFLNGLKYKYFYRTHLHLPQDFMHLLNDLYEEWMPAVMVIFLGTKDPYYLIVALIYFILFPNLPLRWVRDIRKVFQGKDA